MWKERRRLLDLFSAPLWMVPASTFVAGVIGSPHCLSMCGPIVLCFSDRRSQLLAYQLGRLNGYATAGAIAGSMGQSVFGSERPPWLGAFAVITIAVLLVWTGYRVLANRPFHYKIPKFVATFSAYLWRLLRLSDLPKPVAAGLAGALTVLLPCGHLYTFLIGAVATGSAVGGAVFMAAFWLGSAPLLSFGGSFIQHLVRSRGERRQRMAGVILVVAGLASVAAFGARADNYARLLNAAPTEALGNSTEKEHQAAQPEHHCH